MFVEQMREEKNYKRFIGKEEHYNKIGKIIYDLLISLGIKPNDTLLDIGCGSLRIGRYFINYLDESKYYGIDPESWLVLEASRKELGYDIIEKKKPRFIYNDNFNLSGFDRKFDYLLANSIFIHASKKQIEKCLDEAKKSMHINSKFIFNFIEGKDNKNKDWTYPEHITYSKKYIEKQLKKRGFKYKYINCKYPGLQIFLEVKLG